MSMAPNQDPSACRGTARGVVHTGPDSSLSRGVKQLTTIAITPVHDRATTDNAQMANALAKLEKRHMSDHLNNIFSAQAKTLATALPGVTDSFLLSREHRHHPYVQTCVDKVRVLR